MRRDGLRKVAMLLVYSGLALLVLGSMVRAGSPWVGTLMVAVGALDAVTGAVLLGVQALLKNRNRDDKEDR